MTDASKETGKKGDLVFISYTESDWHIADMIYSALESVGIRGWVAHRDIDAGKDWTDEIIKAISQSKIFIGVISSNTENSPYVKNEVTLARDENKMIIPFYIENVSLQRGLKLLLSNYQRINAFPKPPEMYLDELCEIVSRHLGLEPAKPIKKEKLNEEPGAPKVKPVVKDVKAVKEKTMPPKDDKKQPEIVKEVKKEEEIKPKKPLLQKRTLIAVSIILLLTAVVYIISQLGKAMPEDVKAIESKVIKENRKIEIKQNKKGYWEVYYKKYDITMVYIPPGLFTMGSDDGEDDEKPPHEVNLDAYLIGKTEVTNAQYVQFLNDSKIDHKYGCQGKPCIDTDKESKYSHIKGYKGNYHVKKDYEDHPVICVSWFGAVKYCEWLSDKTSLEFHLPTEAQWEKAARGNDRRKYPWGSREPDKNLANFSRNIVKTTPVGSYPAGASPYCLLDMAGNVWEWCVDYYASDYYENVTRENKNKTINNPPGPWGGSDRVTRGGSLSYDARHLRCADRGYVEPSYRFYFVGFRLCQDI